MLTQITINSIDVTDYLFSFDFDGEWQEAIDLLNISFSFDIKEVITVEAGLDIQVKRGYITDTEEFVFDGQITQVFPDPAIMRLVCKNRMYDAIKSGRTRSWDKDIDTSAGVGSEIFKEICDNSSLSYTPVKETLTDGSIYNTGATADLLLNKFVQNDEDDYEKMNELANLYNFIITYDYANARVNFKPKGFTTYPVALRVGHEIKKEIKWKENMEQIINKVKIQGATVYDKIVETFAGAAAEFTLDKTPEDTEVRIDHATTNTLQTRGRKNLGTLGTDFDYYIDVENAKLVFNAPVSDVWINYGAQVPLPVVITNQTSIDKYGGPNKKPHYKKIVYTDIKDINDAEARGRAIINKYSTPFLEANDIAISNETTEIYGPINPGTMVNIIDTLNDKNVTVFVKAVKKSWPHVYDEITVGDQIWRTEDWQADQMKKINQIFNELNKNQDILYQLIDFTRETSFERRDFKLEKRTTLPLNEIEYLTYNTFSNKYGAEWGGQTFTPSSTFELEKIQLQSYRLGTPGTMTISVRATSAGVPTGVDLCSGTVDADTFSTSNPGDYNEVVLTPKITLTSGTKYAFIFRCPSGSVGADELLFTLHTTGTFADGNWVNSSNSGSSWGGNANYDINFKIYSTGITDITAYLGQGQSAYKELAYDSDYFDSVNSDAEVVWNTADRLILIPEGKTLYTLSLEINSGRTEFTLSLGDLTNTNSNTVLYEITGDNSTWQEFTPGVKGYFSTPSTDIRIRITNEAP